MVTRSEMNNNNNGGGTADLPQEVLSLLPSDPYEQLDVARKITSIAISTRLSQLETESTKLQQKMSEKDQIIVSLQDRVAELEQAFQEASARLSEALEDQAKLTTDRNNLAATVKKLTRDVAKLETFKRTLMQSLQEDDETSAQSGTIEKINGSQLTSLDSSVSTSSSLSEADISRVPQQDYRIGGSARAVSLKYSSLQSDEIDASKSVLSKAYSLTPPRLTPRLTPTGSPKRLSGTSSPFFSESGSPKHSLSYSSSQPSSKRTTAPNSPPKGSFSATRTPRLDGKEFFRKARNQLSYEQFSAFLANIKDLNAHKQTKEETLRKAEEIFGPENKDLYQSFEGLLSRHLPGQAS